MIAFGINSDDLDAAAAALGAALGLDFKPHESSWRGGDYCCAETSHGSVFLQENLDVIDDEPFEADWPQNQLVLYFDGRDDQAWDPLLARLCALDGILSTRLLAESV